MKHYRFESEWVVSAPAVDVFDVLVSPDEYSRWWSSVENSRLISNGGPDGIGAVASYSIRSPLRYRLDFIATLLEARRPTRIHMQARGDLVGSGIFDIAEKDGNTVTTYRWEVSTAKHWMNLLAPVARPLFVWAHHHVMREGCTGLARELGASLVSTKSSLVPDPDR